MQVRSEFYKQIIESLLRRRFDYLSLPICGFDATVQLSERRYYECRMLQRAGCLVKRLRKFKRFFRALRLE